MQDRKENTAIAIAANEALVHECDRITDKIMHEWKRGQFELDFLDFLAFSLCDKQQPLPATLDLYHAALDEYRVKYKPAPPFENKMVTRFYEKVIELAKHETNNFKELSLDQANKFFTSPDKVSVKEVEVKETKEHKEPNRNRLFCLDANSDRMFYWIGSLDKKFKNELRKLPLSVCQVLNRQCVVELINRGYLPFEKAITLTIKEAVLLNAAVIRNAIVCNAMPIDDALKLTKLTDGDCKKIFGFTLKELLASGSKDYIRNPFERDHFSRSSAYCR